MHIAAFMAWLEDSMLGHAMRDHGVWTYGIVNLGHILGISALFGSILVLDLRLMGVWRQIPLAVLAKPIVPLAATGFVLATVTGAGMLATKASEYVGNPFLYIKLPAIALALLNLLLLHRSLAWKAALSGVATPHQNARLIAQGGASLVCWLTAMGAGRMIGYW